MSSKQLGWCRGIRHQRTQASASRGNLCLLFELNLLTCVKGARPLLARIAKPNNECMSLMTFRADFNSPQSSLRAPYVCNIAVAARKGSRLTSSTSSYAGCTLFPIWPVNVCLLRDTRPSTECPQTGPVAAADVADQTWPEAAHNLDFVVGEKPLQEPASFDVAQRQRVWQTETG